MKNVSNKIKEYLVNGGLFNPELMDHQAVSDMVVECQDEITHLRLALSFFLARDAEKPLSWKYNRNQAEDMTVELLKNYDIRDLISSTVLGSSTTS